MTAIYLPPNPTLGQEYVATNGVTYIWLDNRWNSTAPIIAGTASYFDEGGDAFTWDTPSQVNPGDGLLDGGSSNGEEVQHVSITEVAVNSEFVTVYYTITNVSGQGYSEQGIIIGTHSVAYATAEDACVGGPSIHGSLRTSMKVDFGQYTDCGQSTLTDINDGSYVQRLGAYAFSSQMVNVVAYVLKDGIAYYSDMHTVTVPYVPCLTAGTKITLADGSKKNIEHITYDDMLKVWDFDLGIESAAKPLWIKVPQQSSSFNRSYFSDGTVLDSLQVEKGHRVYNKTQNKFTFINQCQTGDEISFDGSSAQFVFSKEVKEDVRYYNIITNYHMNLYANDVLTSTGFNNLYPMEDMKFVKQPRSERTYDNIDSTWVQGLRLSENTTEDVDAMAKYLANLLKLKLQD